ncbi:MAG: hypothetical protein QOF61_212 [Acidobacteriota bacterium]|jgi:hypothetical protein|nr:hypothetical protein [Acidobacteriota bacterium]
MFELYFVLYRIPKMMSRLARERNRSAVVWSLFGIAAWIGAELSVAFGFGIVYALGTTFWGWEPEMPAGLRLLSYVVALAAALGGVTLARHILYTKSAYPSESHPSFLTPPPPPPEF